MESSESDIETQLLWTLADSEASMNFITGLTPSFQHDIDAMISRSLVINRNQSLPIRNLSKSVGV